MLEYEQGEGLERWGNVQERPLLTKKNRVDEEPRKEPYRWEEELLGEES